MSMKTKLFAAAAAAVMISAVSAGTAFADGFTNTSTPGFTIGAARAGPEPPNPPELAPVRTVPVSPPETTIEPARSASPTPGAPSRPEPVDPRAAVMARLTELDRQRRRLRDWMDTEESGAALEPPVGAPDAATDA